MRFLSIAGCQSLKKPVVRCEWNKMNFNIRDNMKDIVEHRAISDIDLLPKSVSALIIFAAVMAGMSPVYLFSYAYLDDYTLIQQLIQGAYQGIAWDIMSGRPGYAMLRLFAFKISSNMDSLNYIRFFASISVAIFGVYIFLFFSRRKILRDNYERLFMSLGICLIPSLQVYASWVTCFPFTLSVLLSLASYDVLTYKSKINDAFKFIISSILIILSFSIYQPAAMCFLFFVFADNCLIRSSISYRNIILSFLITCVGMFSSVFMAKIIPMHMYGHTLDRTNITHDITGKLDWFIHNPIPMTIKNYLISSHETYAIFSFFIILIGLSAIYRSESRLHKIFLFIILSIGSYSLNLAIAESWTAYRSLIGMSMIVSSVFLLGILRISLGCGKFRIFILITTSIAAVVLSQYNIMRGFVIPQKGEIQALSSEISNKIPKDYTGNVMFDISNPTFFAFEEIQISDEFGNISSAAPWSIPGMVSYIKMKKGFNFKIPENPIVSENNKCDKDCIIISSSDALRRATSSY